VIEISFFHKLSFKKIGLVQKEYKHIKQERKTQALSELIKMGDYLLN
jgi:hypothetical protein